MLPQKTFLKRRYELFESDFDVNNNIRLNRFMQLLQNAATEHAEKLGFGWDALNACNVLWVLSKVKIVFCAHIVKGVTCLDIVTWPKAPNKFFADRLFEVYDDKGAHVASVLSVWVVIDKTARRMVSADRLADLYKADFDEATVDVTADFVRLRNGDDFAPAYTLPVMRSLLDVNKHVNNTNYVTLASDATSGQMPGVLEIVYHKEIVGGNIEVSVRRGDKCEDVVGVVDGVLCFTVHFEYKF